MDSVRTGIDILLRDGLRLLDGARCGLVTNHTGLSAEGVPTVDILHAGGNARLEALFSPEHGIRGAVDESVADGRDERTGLPVHSLYGPRNEPAGEHLKGIDTLVFDIQDIGCRFYTYLSTLVHCLEAASRHKIRVVVLDRPNPIGGDAVEGPLADESRLSFVAIHPIPVRHGMTLGELARLIVADRGLSVELVVVKCEGWKRRDWWDATGLVWTNPSPNMRSLTAAALYPGVGLLEITNVSVGRGTDRPFELFGAPWIDPRTLASAVNDAKVPGVRAMPVRFTPQGSKFEGEVCGGIDLLVTDRVKLAPVRLGIELALALRRLWPETWQASKLMTLLVNRSAMDGILAGDSYTTLLREWSGGLRAFGEVRRHFLLYD